MDYVQWCRGEIKNQGVSYTKRIYTSRGVRRKKILWKVLKSR